MLLRPTLDFSDIGTTSRPFIYDVFSGRLLLVMTKSLFPTGFCSTVPCGRGFLFLKTHRNLLLLPITFRYVLTPLYKILPVPRSIFLSLHFPVTHHPRSGIFRSKTMDSVLTTCRHHSVNRVAAVLFSIDRVRFLHPRYKKTLHCQQIVVIIIIIIVAIGSSSHGHN